MTYYTAVLLGRRNGEDNQHYILINLPSYCYLITQAGPMEMVSLLMICLYVTASSIHIWSSNIMILFSNKYCALHTLTVDMLLVQSLWQAFIQTKMIWGIFFVPSCPPSPHFILFLKSFPHCYSHSRSFLFLPSQKSPIQNHRGY